MALWIWEELGIDATGDARAIRKAYAQRLKQVHPEDDPEGFKRLRAAYEAALSFGERPQAEPQSMAEPARAKVEPEESPEPGPEDPYEERLAHARALAQELLEIATVKGCDAAVTRLKAQFASKELQDLELKFLLESHLQGAHLEEVARRFRTEEAYADLIRRREQLRFSASQPTASREEKARHLALVLLTSSFKLGLFYRSLWRYPELAKVIPAQIQALQQDAPAAIERHLDAETVRWWLKRRPVATPPLAAYFGKRKLVTGWFAFMIVAGVSQAAFLPVYLRVFLCSAVILTAVAIVIEAKWPRFSDRLKAFPLEIGLPVGLLFGVIAIGVDILPTVHVSSANLSKAVREQEKAGVPSGFLFEKIVWLSRANWYGLKPGDIVTKYGPDRVTDGKSFEAARNLRITVHTPRVKLVLMRSGRPMEFDVPVGRLGFEGRDWTFMRDRITALIRKGDRDEAAQLLAQVDKDSSIARKDVLILKALLVKSSN